MTPDEIDRISRSWVGHIATNPDVRASMNELVAADDAEGMADLINATVAPENPVGSGDVPAIQICVNGMLVAADDGDDQSILQHTGPPPPPPTG